MNDTNTAPESSAPSGEWFDALDDTRNAVDRSFTRYVRGCQDVGEPPTVEGFALWLREHGNS